jgi:hypothetical protein
MSAGVWQDCLDAETQMLFAVPADREASAR